MNYLISIRYALESQKNISQKVHLEVTYTIPLLKTGAALELSQFCSGPCPAMFSVPPKMESPQLL